MSSSVYSSSTFSNDIQKRRSEIVQISKQVGADECIRLYKLLESIKSGDKAGIDQFYEPSSNSPAGQAIQNAALNPLILAVQCASPDIVNYILEKKKLDINATDPDGQTALHHAARLDRRDVIEILFKYPNLDENARDNSGRKAYECARNSEAAKLMRNHLKSRQAEIMQKFHLHYRENNFQALDALMEDPFAHSFISIDQPAPPSTVSPLQEAVKQRNAQMVKWLLRNGADCYKRNEAGKSAMEMCKDETIKHILQENHNGGIQDINYPNQPIKMTGYLKKWTNYKSGYKMRWVILENGEISYFKNPEDTSNACRGSIKLASARVRYDTSSKNAFDIYGGGGSKLAFKASHPVEAQRWVWAISTSIQQIKDLKALKRTTSADSRKSSSLQEHIAFEYLHDNYSRSNISGDSIHRNTEDDDDSITGDQDAQNLEKQLDDLYLAANTLNLQLILTHQLSVGILGELKNGNTDKAVELVGSLQNSIDTMKDSYQDIYRAAKEREIIWVKKLHNESELRRIWEDSIQKLAIEQEAMEKALQKAELDRKRTRKVLRALNNKIGSGTPKSPISTNSFDEQQIRANIIAEATNNDLDTSRLELSREILEELEEIPVSDSDSEVDEFFDAVASNTESGLNKDIKSIESLQQLEKYDCYGELGSKIAVSFKGYDHPIREQLHLVDDRPKLSLWSILKSMIGKDMTKMTLPVTFNEPTSLLYRAAEDMEYAQLLNIASTFTDKYKRMLYVAAFAASEYSSTTLRVAKPFNPLLGETFEYCRPDLKYRFVIEQVSHHPPIGAAYAESPYWEYYGESSVKSRFYGKSFDINPLGTWFLKLRHADGEDFYSWKKVTSSVVGIITGSPSVDNYGLMEVKCHTSGEKCILNFKPRGWRSHSAYEVKGQVETEDGLAVYTIAGHWNTRLFARASNAQDEPFVIWEVNERPPAPFNLTKFVISLNHLPEDLKPWLPPTDSRFRPDQRAMEEGRYDEAATEKERLEDAQRKRRRQREARGIDYKPRWFFASKHPITHEPYWEFTGEYWKMRDAVGQAKLEGSNDVNWTKVEPIYD